MSIALERRYDVYIETLTNSVIHPKMPFINGDTLSFIDFYFKSGSSDLDLTGKTFTINVKKPNGTVGTFSILSVAGNKVTWKLQNTSTNSIGVYLADITVYDGGEIYTSFKFKYIVADNISELDEIVNDDRYNILSNLIERNNVISDNEQGRIDSETLRESNENTRILSETTRGVSESTRNDNEATRVSNENTRKSNETSRISSESTRVTNENKRITDETSRNNAEATRVSNENTRILNENTRKDNETNRVNVESNRVIAENTRESNEATRKANEVTRENSEATRVSNEDSRVIAETTRASNESTRQSNESARQTKETERQASETTRIASEDTRIANENSRKTAETSRVSAESTRTSNETTRQTNETNRVNAENTRATTFNTIKADYITYKNVMIAESNVANLQSQINTVNEQLADNMTQSLVTDSPITTLANAQDGIMQVESIKGKTLKNEIYYNPATWAEWSKDIQCPVSNGYLVLDNNNIGINIKLNTALKPNTKYGALMHTKTNTRTTPFHFIVDEAFTTRSVINAGETGDFKFIVTTNPTITFNRLYSWASTDTGKIEYGNIRLFELPTGSQIEKDFDTLTAGQLAIKYPFFLGIMSTGMGSSDVKAITTDFTGKVAGSVVENPNIAKIVYNSALLSPSSFVAEMSQSSYEYLKTLNNICASPVSTTNGNYPQQLLSWNLIETVERKIGSIGNTVADKVTWLKNNLSKITCNWWGFGSSPLGNKAYLSVWRPLVGDYDIASRRTNSSNSPSLLSYPSNASYLDAGNLIDANGFIHFLAHTDASDGVTPSTINTDYVNLTIEFKAWQRPKTDSENNKIEILSTGKNLFDKVSWVKSSSTYLTETENGILSKGIDGRSWITAMPMIKLKPNTKYVFSCINNNQKLIEIKSPYGLYGTISPNKGINASISFTTDWSGLVGFKFNPLEGTGDFTNIQLEEGTVASTPEAFKQDKLEILLPSPHRGIPNGASDEIFYALNKRTKRVEKYTLNGSEVWTTGTNKATSYEFTTKLPNTVTGKPDTIVCISDKFTSFTSSGLSLLNDGEGIAISSSGSLRVYIAGTKLTTQDVAGFKAWLASNPVTVYYELAVPVEETLNLSSLKCFKGGTIQLNNAITPTVSIKYPSNVVSRLSGLESELDRVFDSLGGAWKTLLILADRELRMKSISLLATETVVDMKNKINEILNVWR